MSINRLSSFKTSLFPQTNNRLLQPKSRSLWSIPCSATTSDPITKHKIRDITGQTTSESETGEKEEELSSETDGVNTKVTAPPAKKVLCSYDDIITESSTFRQKLSGSSFEKRIESLIQALSDTPTKTPLDKTSSWNREFLVDMEGSISLVDMEGCASSPVPNHLKAKISFIPADSDRDQPKGFYHFSFTDIEDDTVLSGYFREDGEKGFLSSLEEGLYSQAKLSKLWSGFSSILEGRSSCVDRPPLRYEDLIPTSQKGNLPEFMATHDIKGTFEQRMAKFIDVLRQGTTLDPLDLTKPATWSRSIDMGTRGQAKTLKGIPHHLEMTISYQPPIKDSKPNSVSFNNGRVSFSTHNGRFSYFTSDAQGVNGNNGYLNLDGQSGFGNWLGKNQFKGSDLLDLWHGVCALVGASNVALKDLANVDCPHGNWHDKSEETSKFDLRPLRVFTEKDSKSFYERRGYEPTNPKEIAQLDGEDISDEPSPSAYRASVSYLADQKMGDLFGMFQAVERDIETAPKTLEILRKAKDLTKANDSTPLAEVIRKVYTVFKSSTCDKETHELFHDLYDHVIAPPVKLSSELTEKMITNKALRRNPDAIDLVVMADAVAVVTQKEHFIRRSFSPTGEV